MPSRFRASLRRIADRAAKLADTRLAFVALAAINVAAMFSLSVPVGPFLVAYCVACPRRWKAFALTSAVTTAVAALGLYWTLITWAQPAIAAQIPEVTRSPEWIRLSGWVADYGPLAMFAWLALPLPQAPFMVIASMLNASPIALGLAFLFGKGTKYAVSAYLAAKASEVTIGRTPDEPTT